MCSATSRRRFEFELLGEPTTITTSHCGAMSFTASWRVFVALPKSSRLGAPVVRERALWAHRLRHAMRAEDHRAAGRHLLELVDEHRAFRAQVLDHELVVHDLVPHVDRRAELVERALDDLDRALDPGAEAAGVGEENVHARFSHAGRRAYAASNAFSRPGWAPRTPSTTRLAQSKYSRRRCESQCAGG